MSFGRSGKGLDTNWNFGAEFGWWDDGWVKKVILALGWVVEAPGSEWSSGQKKVKNFLLRF